MSDTENKTVRAVVTRDFNDAGTDTLFAKDEKHSFTPGEFLNYRTAGLVEAIVDEPSAADAGELDPSR